MAAYTIGYQPQFVQSDIGSIQKRLAEMQSQYDTAYQGQLEAEDAFGNIPVVSQSDAGLRDEVLGGFKNKVQTIVDEYGGDYGAASKRLAKEIIATKSNPFFQLASRKAQLAEEQRKLASQPGSIVLQDVRNVNLRDAQGNYISPDQLGYNVTTRDYLRKELGNAYGNLAKKVREGDYQTLRSTPWLMQKAVTQGITEQEVPAVADDMMGTLKQMYPTLPEDVVQSIATEQASQLVLGTQNKEQANWKYQQDYNFGQQKDMYKWQLDEKARREQPAIPPGLPLSSQSYFEVTDEASTSKSIKNKFLSKEGIPVTKFFGKNGETNPVKQYEIANNYVSQRRADLENLYEKYKDSYPNLVKHDKIGIGYKLSNGGISQVFPKEIQTEFNAIKEKHKKSQDASYSGAGISKEEYAYFKNAGISPEDSPEMVVNKLNNYENKQAVRYSKYRLDLTDYNYLTDLLSAQIPKGVEISSTGILQPLDKNLNVKGGTGSREGRFWKPDSFKFNDDFYDSKGNTKINNVEFVPSVGIVISTTDGKQFKLGTGGAKDQLNILTDENSIVRKNINDLINAGYYEEANKLISRAKDAIIPMLTNAQVSINPHKIEN